LNPFSRLIEQEQFWIQLQPARFAFLSQLSGHRNKKLLLFPRSQTHAGTSTF
jgi:hypothetical protein